MGRHYITVMKRVVSEKSEDSDLRAADMNDEAVTQPNDIDVGTPPLSSDGYATQEARV